MAGDDLTSLRDGPHRTVFHRLERKCLQWSYIFDLHTNTYIIKHIPPHRYHKAAFDRSPESYSHAPQPAHRNKPAQSQQAPYPSSPDPDDSTSKSALPTAHVGSDTRPYRTAQTPLRRPSRARPSCRSAGCPVRGRRSRRGRHCVCT